MKHLRLSLQQLSANPARLQRQLHVPPDIALAHRSRNRVMQFFELFSHPADFVSQMDSLHSTATHWQRDLGTKHANWLARATAFESRAPGGYRRFDRGMHPKTGRRCAPPWVKKERPIFTGRPNPGDVHLIRQ